MPLTRFYGNNQAQLPSPFRLLQVGPVWRAQRPAEGPLPSVLPVRHRPDRRAERGPGRGRTHRGHQPGAGGGGARGHHCPAVGSPVPSALAEAARLPEGSRNGFFIVLDKLDKIGWDGVRSELEGLGLPSNSIAVALDTISALQGVEPAKIGDALADAVPTMGSAAIEDLATTTACLDRLAADRPLSWQFDPTLVRGMGYYTGHHLRDEPPVLRLLARWRRAVRQDDRRRPGPRVPAVGFSIGFERIVDLLPERASSPSRSPCSATSDVPTVEILAAARSLRGDGLSVETIRRSGKFGAQLTRLESAGFTAFIQLRNDNGVITRGEVRALGAADSSGGAGPGGIAVIAEAATDACRALAG